MNKIIRPLKELFTAYYDPNVNRICGCEPQSLAWYHETRHQSQFNNRYISKIINISHIAFYSIGITYMLLAFFVDKKFILITGLAAVPYLITTLILEVDAWIYSIKNI